MTSQIKISNIENYTMDCINGDLILTPKCTHDAEDDYVSEDEILKMDLTNSKILECNIKHRNVSISCKTKYKRVLTDIWCITPVQKILQNTTFNIKLTDENTLNGFIWDKKLNMSVQNKNASLTFKEIINMVNVNNCTIKISIKLETNKIIHFKNY